MTAPTHMPDTGQIVVATRQGGSGLTATDIRELKVIQSGIYPGSFAEENRRAKLCRRGYANRTGVGPWRWYLTDAGRAALAASEAHDAGCNDG